MIIERTVEIDARPDVVWAVGSDVERWHEWTKSITWVRLLDAGPLRVGTRARIKQPRLPPLVWTVTSLVPGESFVWETRSPGARTIGEHRLAPRPDGGSTATLRLVQTGFVNRLLRPFIAGMSRRYVEMEAQGLKRRCEEAARGR